MSTVEVSKGRLYYEEHGVGRPILYIHGSCADGTVWSDWVGPVSKFGRVILYDRRGNSRSQVMTDAMTTSLSEQAEDAGALLEVLEATPAIVIGQGFGGAVALELARRRPGWVSRIVLLEAALPELLPTGALQWLISSISLVAAGDGAQSAETFVRMFLGDVGWPNLPDSLKQTFRVNGRAMLAELDALLHASEHPASLRDLVQPTLCVAATSSLWIMRAVMERAAVILPRGRFALAEGGQRLDPSVPLVLQFIREIDASAVWRTPRQIGGYARVRLQKSGSAPAVQARSI